MFDALTNFLGGLGKGASNLFSGIFGGGGGSNVFNQQISSLNPGTLDFASNALGQNPTDLVGNFGNQTLGDVYNLAGMNVPNQQGGIFGNMLNGENFGSALQGVGSIMGYMNDREKTKMMQDMMKQQLAAMQRQENRAVHSYNEAAADRDFGRSIAVDENGNVVPGLHTRQHNPMV